MQEIPLFCWDNEVLKKHETAIASSTASSSSSPPAVRGGALANKESTMWLVWRSYGSVLDLALVSLIDSIASTQIRFRFASEVSSAIASFQQENNTHVLAVCTRAGEVFCIPNALLQHHHHQQVSKPFIFKHGAELTSSCFTTNNQSLTLWAGFDNGTVSMYLLASGETRDFELKSTTSSGGWLQSFVSSSPTAGDPITHLLPCKQDDTFVLAVNSQGYVKLFTVKTSSNNNKQHQASAVARPFADGEPVHSVVSFQEDEHSERVSFAFFKRSGEAVALYWDKHTMFGMVGAFGKQMDLIHLQNSVLARWNTAQEQSTIQVGSSKLVSTCPPSLDLLVEAPASTVECVSAVSFDFTPDQIEQALLPLQLSRFMQDSEMSTTEVQEFKVALGKVWKRDQEILQVLPQCESALLARTIVPVVRKCGLTVVLISAYISATTFPTELDNIAEAAQHGDFTSTVERLQESLGSGGHVSMPPSLVVMDLIKQNLTKPKPVYYHQSSSAGLNPMYLAHVLMKHVLDMQQMLERLAVWCVLQKDLPTASKLLMRVKHVQLIPVLIRSAFATAASSHTVALDSHLFVEGEAPLFPAQQQQQHHQRVGGNSFLQWAQRTNISYNPVLGDFPHQLLTQFCPLDLQQATSVTWQLAKRPAEVESLKLVCELLVPSQRAAVLHALTLLFDEDYVNAKWAFHRAIPEANKPQYFQAVAVLFIAQPEVSFFFCKLGLNLLPESNNKGSSSALLVDFAFETSLLLKDANEAMQLIQVQPPAQQGPWLVKLVNNLLLTNRLALLLELKITDLALVFTARDAMFNLIPRIDTEQFLIAYSFFIVNAMFESAAKFAYLFHMQQGGAELTALSLCLSAMASLPNTNDNNSMGLEINNAGEFVSLQELKQMYAYLSAKQQLFGGKKQDDMTPIELYEAMLDQINTRNEVFCMSAYHLAKLWHFPTEHVFLRLDSKSQARQMLSLRGIVHSRAEQIHIATQLVLTYKSVPAQELQAWVDLFQEWRSLALLIELLSSRLGMWLRATEIAGRYFEELYQREVCFPVLDRILCRADRFALHSEEAEYVCDVNTAHDAQALKKAAQLLASKLKSSN